MLVIIGIQLICSDLTTTIGNPVEYSNKNPDEDRIIATIPPNTKYLDFIPNKISRKGNEQNQPGSYVPIKTLTLHSNNWTVKVRVTKMGQIKNYKNTRGEGRVVSLELIDEEGTQIMGALFNQAIDAHFNKIQEGGVYLITNGAVKMSCKKFTSINNDFFINIEQNTRIAPAYDDRSIKSTEEIFVPIEKIKNLQNGAIINVVGVVKSLSKTVEITARAGNTCTKRTFKLFDDSNSDIEVLLWKNFTSLNFRTGQIVIMKNMRVGLYYGRQISTMDHSVILIQPNHERAKKLAAWIASQPHLQKVKSSIAQIKKCHRVLYNSLLIFNSA